MNNDNNKYRGKENSSSCPFKTRRNKKPKNKQKKKKIKIKSKKPAYFSTRELSIDNLRTYSIT